MSLHKKLGLKPDETIVVIVRPFVLAQWWLYTLSLLIIGTTAFFATWWVQRGVFGYVLGLIGLGLAIYITVYARGLNRRNFWVITTERVIDVIAKRLLHRQSSGVRYSEIMAVGSARQGLGSTLFNHGTVVLELSDDQGSIELRQVRFPERLERLILERKEIATSQLSDRKLSDLFGLFLDNLPRFKEAQLILIEKKVQDQLAKVDKPE